MEILTEIKIKDHIILPNLKVIEIFEHNNLIATIIPRDKVISIVSKYIENVETDLIEYPPTITISLKEDDTITDVFRKVSHRFHCLIKERIVSFRDCFKCSDTTNEDETCFVMRKAMDKAIGEEKE